MITGDASYIKKINRSLIIREIVKKGMISRADLSKAVDLTRATISVQVADLLEDELVVETHLEHNAVGRKPIMLSLNADAGYALGIDLDYEQISFALTDLLGHLVFSNTVKLETTDYSEILALIIKHITTYKNNYTSSRYGIIGIVIAVHGLVSNQEVIHYVPRLGWNDVNLKADLETALDLEIHLENNSNLSSFAERVYVHHDTDNLLSATFHSGIGLGMIINNKFFRGHDGFAGEIGHMIVMPGGRSCKCGNKGCWEQYASESNMMELLSEKKSTPNITYEQIKQWMEQGDTEITEIMDEFIYYLSIGLNNMINIYNPDVIVIDSELLRIYPDSIHKIKQNLHSQISHYRELLISTLGKDSSILGACGLAIQYFLDVPVLNLPNVMEASE